MPNKNASCSWYLAFPIGAVFSVAGATAAALQGKVPWWLSLVLGLALGVLLLFSYVAVSGDDLTDVIVGSVIIFVLSCILGAVFFQKHATDQRKLRNATPVSRFKN